MLRHFWLSYKNCIKSLQQVVKIVSQTVRGLLLDIEVGTIKKESTITPLKNTLVINQNKLRKIVVKRLKAFFIVQGFAMNLYPDGKCTRLTREGGNRGMGAL